MSFKLAYSPAPYRDECFKGYLTRTSEDNGYPSPGWITGLIHPTFPNTNLSAWMRVGRKFPSMCQGYEAATNALFPQPAGDTAKLVFHGNVIGREELTTASEAICPSCIEELGYQPAIFSLARVLACPKHSALLLTHCDSCNRAISWRRPKLLECKCGAEYLRAPKVSASESDICMAKLFTFSFPSPFSIDRGFLSEVWRNTTPEEISASFKLIGSVVPSIKSPIWKENDGVSYPGLIVPVFTEWPRGFAGFYRKLLTVRSLMESSTALKLRESIKVYNDQKYRTLAEGLEWAESGKLFDVEVTPRKSIPGPYVAFDHACDQLSIDADQVKKLIRVGAINPQYFGPSGKKFILESELNRLKQGQTVNVHSKKLASFLKTTHKFATLLLKKNTDPHLAPHNSVISCELKALNALLSSATIKRPMVVEPQWYVNLRALPKAAQYLGIDENQLGKFWRQNKVPPRVLHRVSSGSIKPLYCVWDIVVAKYPRIQIPQLLAHQIIPHRLKYGTNSGNEVSKSFYRARQSQFIHLSLIIDFATQFVPSDSKLLSKIKDTSLTKAIERAPKTEYLSQSGRHRWQCISFKALGRLQESINCPHAGAKIPRIDPILWQTALSSVTGSRQ